MCIVLTIIDRDVTGDVTFPEFSEKEFYVAESTRYQDSSEPFTVVTYRRR
jgi:hypothetical protein